MTSHISSFKQIEHKNLLFLIRLTDVSLTLCLCLADSTATHTGSEILSVET